MNKIIRNDILSLLEFFDNCNFFDNFIRLKCIELAYIFSGERILYEETHMSITFQFSAENILNERQRDWLKSYYSAIIYGNNQEKKDRRAHV